MRFKYTIFKHKAGLLMPVIYPEHVTHSQVIIKQDKDTDMEIIGAGFFTLGKGTLTVTSEKSESLNIGPSEIDEQVLELMLSNAPMSSFIE